MSTDTQKVMDRVRKMMALANDAGASEGERDNALRMAHATLAKYNLSMAQVEAAGGTAEQRIFGHYETRSRPWIRTCYQAVATLFFCEYFYTTPRQNYMKNYFVGKESNVATANEIAQYVVNSILKEGAREMRNKLQDIAWRVSFQKGAAYRINERCGELRAEAERASQGDKVPGTALVLASVYATEKAANAAFLEEKVGKPKEVKSRERKPGAGFWDGHDYAETVSLNRQVQDQRVKGELE